MKRSLPLCRLCASQFKQWTESEHAWLEQKIRLVIAEVLLNGRIRPKRNRVVKEFFQTSEDLSAPPLTEVLLATLLRREDMPYELATYSDLFADSARMQRMLDSTSCVFVSTTFLRDLSELQPVVRMLKRPHNRIVVGGPLASLLREHADDLEDVDLLAAGYGEFLVPALVKWIRSGYQRLEPPAGGRFEPGRRVGTLYSGVPPTHDLDFLPSPDWALSQRDRAQRYPMIYYESVRGCPYRCSFCNYPYLFSDTKFRYKSARKMAEEWKEYREQLGVEYITCLDSLFTMPRRRMVEFCRLLIQAKLGIKWICFARTDDLADEEVTAMMKEAGAHQVLIGLESGDQQQLDNMDKQCSVEANAKAIDNCRKYGLTSIVSLIAGFPGETEQTLENTYRFMCEHPPDFYFLVTFSTRATDVPILNAMNRERFDLATHSGLNTGSPYWRHRTMSCAEVGNHVRALHRRLMENRVSLQAGLFFQGLLRYKPEQRQALLDYQQRVARRNVLTPLFNGLNWFVDRSLRRDVEQCLGASVNETCSSANLLAQ
jgi:radical SAM superfamily enzyme YgiQ (UPF0313 family)